MTRFNAPDNLPCLQKLRAGNFVDPGIRTCANNRPGICRIYDGIYGHLSYIISNYFKRHILQSLLSFLSSYRKVLLIFMLASNTPKVNLRSKLLILPLRHFSKCQQAQKDPKAK
jgi:hypothetical protein